MDINSFCERYQSATHALNPPALSGLIQLLNFIETDADINDVRWKAYMLATVRHECAGEWAPVREYGLGRNRPYGEPINGKVYYGRGYVQLTWIKNYSHIGAAIGYGMDLVNDPDLVLKPNIAYAIMSYGMQKGLFTGVGLKNFINDSGCDYVSARKIINGTDQAQKIADYATQFEGLLR